MELNVSYASRGKIFGASGFIASLKMPIPAKSAMSLTDGGSGSDKNNDFRTYEKKSSEKWKEEKKNQGKKWQIFFEIVQSFSNQFVLSCSFFFLLLFVAVFREFWLKFFFFWFGSAQKFARIHFCIFSPYFSASSFFLFRQKFLSQFFFFFFCCCWFFLGEGGGGRSPTCEAAISHSSSWSRKWSKLIGAAACCLRLRCRSTWKLCSRASSRRTSDLAFRPLKTVANKCKYRNWSSIDGIFGSAEKNPIFLVNIFWPKHFCRVLSIFFWLFLAFFFCFLLFSLLLFFLCVFVVCLFVLFSVSHLSLFFHTRIRRSESAIRRTSALQKRVQLAPRIRRFDGKKFWRRIFPQLDQKF